MTVKDILKYVDNGVEIEIYKGGWIDTRVPTKEHLSHEWHLDFDGMLVYNVKFLKSTVTINLL